MSETILITGSSGFIGSYISTELKHNYTCVGISRSQNIDITCSSDLRKMSVDPDIIIHTAAVLSNDVEEAFQVNVVGTLNICKYAKEKNVRHLILISSLSVYERAENEYFDVYGRTKKQSEEIAEAYCNENNIKLTILRLSQVYDDRGLAKSSQGMLYYFIDTIKSKQKISIFGNKNPLRNYIHINYLTQLIQDVIKKGNAGVYNVREDKNHTITEIAYIIFGLLKITPDIILLKDKPDIGSVFIPEKNRYKSSIESISLKDGIQRILNNDK